jgi:hypothetical protein
MSAFTIGSASIRADAVGSITCTVKRDRSGTVETIGTITLSSAIGIASVDISGWSNLGLLAGDVLIFEFAGASGLTRATVVLGGA